LAEISRQSANIQAPVNIGKNECNYSYALLSQGKRITERALPHELMTLGIKKDYYYILFLIQLEILTTGYGASFNPNLGSSGRI
jgi:hypothetical protein